MIGRIFGTAVALASLTLHAQEAPFVREKAKATLHCKEVDEASGLASSPASPDFLWLINDSGSPADLHLADTDGNDRGKVSIEGAKNTDWEDLASFVCEGKPYLLIADTGDNASKRTECTLYIVPEPRLPKGDKKLKGSASPAWTIRFRYEDGPRDCESVAVDEKAGKILLLSKRTSPPMLYELPLKPAGGGQQVAKKIGSIPNELPAGFPPIPFGTQPTGLDISEDGSQAAVVTYYCTFLFPRQKGEGWAAVFARKPVQLKAHRLRQAESVAFSRDGSLLRVVSEGGKSPIVIYRRGGGEK